MDKKDKEPRREYDKRLLSRRLSMQFYIITTIMAIKVTHYSNNNIDKYLLKFEQIFYFFSQKKFKKFSGFDRVAQIFYALQSGASCAVVCLLKS